MFRKILRIIGIILLGVTAVITLLGGIGTTCVALNAANYEDGSDCPIPMAVHFLRPIGHCYRRTRHLGSGGAG
ncbi:MAG: hypothetical protein M5U34_06915 [Chloroflexi bacterium]|nr:hypothetical protein [Chloroflexota bacterium]